MFHKKFFCVCFFFIRIVLNPPISGENWYFIMLNLLVSEPGVFIFLKLFNIFEHIFTNLLHKGLHIFG